MASFLTVWTGTARSLRFQVQTLSHLESPGSVSEPASPCPHRRLLPASQAEKEETNTSVGLPGSGLQKTVSPPTPSTQSTLRAKLKSCQPELNTHVSPHHRQTGSDFYYALPITWGQWTYRGICLPTPIVSSPQPQ